MILYICFKYLTGFLVDFPFFFSGLQGCFFVCPSIVKGLLVFFALCLGILGEGSFLA